MEPRAPLETANAGWHEPATAWAWDEFRRQESTLVLLNLLALASIVVIHLVFWSLLERPSLAVAIALGLRFLEQAGEYSWLQRPRRAPSRRVLLACSYGSIWANVAFAFLMGLIGRGHDSHYHLLMVLPMIAAGFRLSRWGLASVVTAGSGLTLLQVSLRYWSRPAERWPEVFEAATMAFIFLVVALVVRLLSGQLERDRHRLRQSLEDLESTRGQLVAEEKLAAVGRMAAALAHEIRNPVAAMASSIALARSGTDRSLDAEMFDVVLDEATRLERLTSEFLGYARPQAPTMLPVPCLALIGYVVGSVRARAEAARVDVAAVAGEEFERPLDPSLMQQALTNLALNAIEATPPRGRVRVGAERRGAGGDAFFVENSAGPIEAADADRLFEPFFTTRRHGTGLGLAIARNIARAHGGDVALARNEPGLVRFEVVVPAAVPTAATPAGREAEALWRES